MKCIRMIRKLLILIWIPCLLLILSPHGHAEETVNFEGKEDYYNKLCLGDTELSGDEKSLCESYSTYLSNKSSDLQSRLDEIEAKREEIAANIQEKIKEINSYQKEIDSLQEQINSLNKEIANFETEIARLETEISENEASKDELTEKVKMRMDAAQDTMRLNQYLDYIMGAESFTDLLRRISGTNDLMEYDASIREELVTTINYLSELKTSMQGFKEQLEASKAELSKKKTELAVKQKEAEVVKEEWQRQSAEWEAEGNQIASNLNTIKKEIKEMADKIGAIPASTGWTKPTPNYAYKTAGTWHYPSSGGSLSGGVHLGLDLGYGTGTPVYAVANGLIIVSVDGCSNNGYLGNTCGSSQGGTQGGGNQLYMLTRVNSMLYAVKYLHLKQGTLIAKNSVVTAGDKIAEMGASGNVTGAHLHIEIYKLGDYSIDEYIEKWNGNLAFGCGFGASALSRTCENSGAPCRMRPEELLGY